MGHPAARSRPVGGHHDDSDRGFTLIELLVVVVILGILIAIAIPVYLNYKKGANDRAAMSDLRGAVSVLEQCQGDNSAYPATIAAGVTAGVSGAACAGRPINVSTGTVMTYFPISASDLSGYIISATNAGGSGKTYCFNSVRAGAIVSTSTAVTAYRNPC